MYSFFKNIFHGINVPVVVCGCGENCPVIYENPEAKGLLHPGGGGRGGIDRGGAALRQALRFGDEGGYDAFMAALKAGEGLSEYVAVIAGGDGQAQPVTITASRAGFGEDYYVIYIYPARSLAQEKGGVLAAAAHMAYQADNPEDAINGILALVGGYAGVSRSYIFEPVSDTLISNTYEWCASGAEPAKHTLQNMSRAACAYDETVARGIYVADDVARLPAAQRTVLQPQGVKSLFIVPIVRHGAALGYAGFDDCQKPRKWGAGEIKLLDEMAVILATLISRRNTDRALGRTLDVLQIISDNSGSAVYVSDISTSEVIFCNRVLAKNLGLKAEDIVGKKCWQVVQKGMDNPCGFCPMDRMLSPNGQIIQTELSWEQRSTVDGKWYLLQDSIIRWHDGRPVHMQTATEISRIKDYEEQLEHRASTDSMTGVYNREWGYKIVKNMLDSPAKQNVSLVFLDIDGLKTVNDTLGHGSGDQMIMTIVDLIKSKIRKSDVICRWGGDEFVLMLRCSEDNAHKIMQGIQQKIEARNSGGDLPFKLSVSYGVASLDGGREDLEAIISRADSRMYQNKHSKRNTD